MYTFFETKTRNTIEGLFNFMYTNLSIQPKLTSSEHLNNMYSMLNLSSDEFAYSDEINNLPFWIDFTFPKKYSFMIFDYLLQGQKNYRALGTWALLGRNSFNEEWQQIDYRDKYDYCNIINNDYCQNETKTIIPCLYPKNPYKYLRLQLINDIMSESSKSLFRIKGFEIYGSLLLTSESVCHHQFIFMKRYFLFIILLH